ncbi:UvrD-helicase domain-containing protein [Geomonas subterranea]|uniref:UvrD-helicase domain-containing protein n=1 Tax=Geomonas subterranea TaxID=2847989 RepID=UPI001CD21C61|nr:UvrD-helicase domain-containing protein [Geomonas fuzhouensis]
MDEEIYTCLDLGQPKSFFLFAGAGSGKTRSLVEVLKRFRANNIQRLRDSGRKVAVITYTNAACDEIQRRLDFDAIFTVSTIHSFAWELIRPYQCDIREWLRGHLKFEIAELEEAQRKGRAGTKAAEDRPRQIASKQARLEALDRIKKFSYNPNGDNTSRDSLNHAEVINITSDFLISKPLMQKIMVQKFPILLVDESQDTKKELVDAFFTVEAEFKGGFTLGLFGDTMQRIYSDGKTDLGRNIPDHWSKPAKIVNYRCPLRVVTLINKIRSNVDDQMQEAAKKEQDGVVRLFIADTSTFLDKTSFEAAVASKMAVVSGDDGWNDVNGAKILTLEHHMAAKRGGFGSFFDPLYAVDKLKTGLLDGKLPGVSLFANQVLPLVKAMETGDNFAVARVVRKYSPLLAKETLKTCKSARAEMLKANEAAKTLYSLWSADSPSLISILKELYRSGLFLIPDSLLPIAARSDGLDEKEDVSTTENYSDKDKVIDAWDEALKTSFQEFEGYLQYISEQSRFGTHQGIKGLQFPRVMVILDDEEARGFLFSYDKLFSAKDLTASDKKNEAEGKETSIERTRRLFYVTCSRAESSLAIIAYTKEPDKVKKHAISQGWFAEDEII